MELCCCAVLTGLTGRGSLRTTEDVVLQREELLKTLQEYGYPQGGVVDFGPCVSGERVMVFPSESMAVLGQSTNQLYTRVTIEANGAQDLQLLSKSERLGMFHLVAVEPKTNKCFTQVLERIKTSDLVDVIRVDCTRADGDPIRLGVNEMRALQRAKVFLELVISSRYDDLEHWERVVERAQDAARHWSRRWRCNVLFTGGGYSSMLRYETKLEFAKEALNIDAKDMKDGEMNALLRAERRRRKQGFLNLVITCAA